MAPSRLPGTHVPTACLRSDKPDSVNFVDLDLAGLADAEAVRVLLADAGFRDIRVRIGIHILRFASAEAYTRGFLAASPMAGEIAAMDEAKQTRMMQEIGAALHPFIDDGGLAAPAEDHTVLART
jgi:hypothetical protein